MNSVLLSPTFSRFKRLSIWMKPNCVTIPQSKKKAIRHYSHDMRLFFHLGLGSHYIEWEHPALNKELNYYVCYINLTLLIQFSLFSVSSCCCNPRVLHSIFTVLYPFDVICNSLFRCTPLVLSSQIRIYIMLMAITVQL